MKKMFKKGLAAMLMAALMLAALSGCQVSSSSSTTTTVSTSVTDENGNTTTNTTTTETGVTAGSDGINTTSTTTKETTTTPADDGAQAQPAADQQSAGADSADAGKEYADSLRDTYNQGAEGTCDSGEKVYYAFNDGTSDVYMVIISADGQNFTGRAGTLYSDDEKLVIQSEQMGDEIEFTASDVDEQGNFSITFLGDGDVAQMHLVDQDTIVTDMVALAQEFDLL